jgi:hypothetical protein
METQPVILYPVSFFGAFMGMLGTLFAPDVLTVVVAAALFFVATLCLGELLFGSPTRR